jgi:hypothetical protein
MNRYVMFGIIIITMIGSTTISYLLALAGRPDNLWIWKDILGVL